jgi:hypothetical protein
VNISEELIPQLQAYDSFVGREDILSWEENWQAIVNRAKGYLWLSGGPESHDIEALAAVTDIPEIVSVTSLLEDATALDGHELALLLDEWGCFFDRRQKGGAFWFHLPADFPRVDRMVPGWNYGFHGKYTPPQYSYWTKEPAARGTLKHRVAQQLLHTFGPMYSVRRALQMKEDQVTLAEISTGEGLSEDELKELFALIE